MRFILAFMLMFSPMAKADWYVPDEVISETGGYVGFLAYGLGYDVGYFNTSLILGYVPEAIGGEDLWSLASKNVIQVPSGEIFDISLIPYGGLNFIWSVDDDDTYVQLPKKYPRKYYPPTGLRTATVFGLEAALDDASVFIEVAALDLYLETYYRSDMELELYEVFTYGFGWKIDL